jgi:hypothetical protein
MLLTLVFFPVVSGIYAPLPPSITEPLNLSVDGKTYRLIDNHGRERVFHGTNVVFKAPPYHPSTGSFDSQFSLCEKDLDFIQSLGFSTIRLSVPWAGVEPQAGFVIDTPFQQCLSSSYFL